MNAKLWSGRSQTRQARQLIICQLNNPVTDEQSCRRREVAKAERIDWQLEGAVGGQLSVI